MTRTLLFDVDQTLLYTGGAGGLAMARAFQQIYGVEDAFHAIEGSGRTDWAILKRGLESHGLLDGTPLEEMLPGFIDVYVEHLPATLRDTPGGHIKPGVPELLDALGERLAGGDDLRLGLATGNFKRACLLKLEYYKLNAHLSDGGFGEDAEDRGDMVAKAIERLTSDSNGRGASAAAERQDPASAPGGDNTGAAAERQDPASAPGGDNTGAVAERQDPASAPGADNTVWIIGDTPRDVQAAIANGARCLAVATGTSSVDELLAEGADVALEDLSDTERVLQALLG